MRIVNPKNDTLLHEVAEDTEQSISDKVKAAWVAQRSWAATPYSERAEILRRFRALVVERTEPMARILTAEVGKPITQSRNELAGLLGRLDFFLDKTGAELSDEVVAGVDTGTEERIRHEPLGVIANVSAWNYPYFVGANVFVPALLTGNAVLYKPSEYATLTGRAIADALSAAGVPEGVFSTVVGGGSVGARLLEELGLGPVQTEMFPWAYHFRTDDELWELVLSMDKFTGQATLSAEIQAEVRRELLTSLAAYRQVDGQWSIPHACRLLWGRRSDKMS